MYRYNVAAPIQNVQKKSEQIYCDYHAPNRPIPGVETPLTPDELDALDASHMPQGLAGYHLRRVCRVRRVGQGSAAGYTKVSDVEILSQHGKVIECERKENFGHGMIKRALGSLTLVVAVKKSFSIFQHSATEAGGQRLVNT